MDRSNETKLPRGRAQVSEMRTLRVLDTCLHPGFRAGRADREKAIVEAVLQSLAYPKVQKAARSKTDPELWFEDIVVLSQLVAGDVEVASVCGDPDDDKYLAAAIEGRAAFVVTGDPDLVTLGEHEGIRIITPRAFLDLLNQ
jgi:uncharacterized protein